jgi:hypothetical protein
MPTSNDYPTNLNPAYQKERKPISGTDYIDVPVFNDEGDEICKERLHFAYEQYDNEMLVWWLKDRITYVLAHQDDIRNTLQDLYKNFNIEYK